MKYEAPDFSTEGVNSFMKILADKDFLDGLEILGAYIKRSFENSSKDKITVNSSPYAVEVYSVR